MTKVGIIGVGLMGHGIAKNILQKGWDLGFLDHVGNQPTADLVALGGVAWGNAAQLAETCDILLLCVTGTPQVEDVLIGSGAALAALRPGAVVVDCSTAIPSSTRALAAQVREKGCDFVDAAMTRTPKEAEEGRLNLLVGGETATIERVRPLFDCFAENIFAAGGVGSGHQLKLTHNIISLGTATLIAEVAACAIQDGMDPEAMVDCLRKGGAGGVALERVAPYILEGSTDALRFSIQNAFKDAGYYTQMASELGAARLMAQAVNDTLAGLVERGNGEAFVPEQVSLLQKP
ncbi:NAD(P)-dependent oxidoreductase [Pseudosulfitobacter pseudonitzschiae]|uniref:NAD(P)-dependent oxidoreductase n=1 Tax=Pseudosulfitobacter pseudonitzschiae TaxID=1402135 RepID=UPI001AF5CC64|nr:NAD(P)-dependent oxidoreductase [Pseudosulfitobacter pseudonitzschiae]MBM1817476.1 NAD(P)-dependent oxidoreductase [Pseudosulfitobacter pseudonitzschiae]MBM1834433.1 NAD(P)-dependent oxidoreductase [Pseudosulfitobacter pseudonitzschiae]MBM1839252.1 NAD(P)-dependent oxidoreductase [Pseudosulfitobacter pseudonitzschiae]MBM1844148.1 NAD(P)-dependent oxidoreductase [Pseudosulfitobacter pseudonitzschiae]MBM1848937.1 NAD(P)-dependent oxidoreductase [Pseudosulfitobacter pseudonitzschiae]